MGWVFDISQANLVGWLTAPRPQLSSALPRLNKDRLLDFFRGVGLHVHPSSLETFGIISDDTAWLQELQERAAYVYETITHRKLDDRSALFALDSFRSLWQNMRLYALGLAHTEADYRRVRAFIEHGAHRTHTKGLFMIPQCWSWPQSIDITSPFPAFELAADATASWPGVLFWTPDGASAFCGIDEADEVLHQATHAMRHDSPLAINDLLRTTRDRQEKPVKIIHLSDLHFGTSAASRSKGYLTAAIERMATQYTLSRVVITGDLFDNPTQAAAQEFRYFRQMIHALTGHDPIVVPGNHDQKLFGNFKWSLGELADLEWSSIVRDDRLAVLFLCFDSSRNADLARGRVSPDQRLNVATALYTMLNADDRLDAYLRIGLLHHHPISFPERATGVWPLLAQFRINQETFLEMKDGDEFLAWCASRQVPLVLHGHKHVPFLATRSGSGRQEVVTVVGCGSSTGAGNLPLSINLLTYDRGQRGWAVSFLIDPGDGSGFKCRAHLDGASDNASVTPRPVQ